MSFSKDDFLAIKKGDVFWESCQYGNLKVLVTSEPLFANGQITFWGRTYDSREYRDVEYHATLDLLHYAPKLCHTPEYGHMIGGEFLPWKDGKGNCKF